MNTHLYAKKSLGQNFLKSKKIINQMIESVSVHKGDVIVEVGPGKGALTGPLLERGACVYAFELDERMIEYLSLTYSDYIENGSLKLVHKDILEVDFSEYFSRKDIYKVVANIPYYITNAIMRKFLESDFQPQEMSLLMQKEVAERIIARNGKQSILSLSVAVFGRTRLITKVSKNYFSPKPRVDSAVIHISQIGKIFSLQKKYDLFFNLVHAGFSHKRKRLFKNLLSVLDIEILNNLFQDFHFDKNIRAEDLPLSFWVDMVNYVSN